MNLYDRERNLISIFNLVLNSSCPDKSRATALVLTKTLRNQ